MRVSTNILCQVLWGVFLRSSKFNELARPMDVILPVASLWQSVGNFRWARDIELLDEISLNFSLCRGCGSESSIPRRMKVTCEPLGAYLHERDLDLAALLTWKRTSPYNSIPFLIIELSSLLLPMPDTLTARSVDLKTSYSGLRSWITFAHSATAELRESEGRNRVFGK